MEVGRGEWPVASECIMFLFLIKFLCLHLVEMQQQYRAPVQSKKEDSVEGTYILNMGYSHFSTLPYDHLIITTFPDPQQMVGQPFSYFHFNLFTGIFFSPNMTTPLNNHSFVVWWWSYWKGLKLDRENNYNTNLWPQNANGFSFKIPWTSLQKSFRRDFQSSTINGSTNLLSLPGKHTPCTADNIQYG